MISVRTRTVVLFVWGEWMSTIMSIWHLWNGWSERGFGPLTIRRSKEEFPTYIREIKEIERYSLLMEVCSKQRLRGIRSLKWEELHPSFLKVNSSMAALRTPSLDFVILSLTVAVKQKLEVKTAETVIISGNQEVVRWKAAFYLISSVW